jgi:two-component system, chemotaxis family, response regulator Rcp1
MNHKELRPVEILLVEDSPTDVLLLKEALLESKIANTMQTVPDGVEAMAYLHREGIYQHAIRPDIILLDLNLPRMDGRQVLAAVKNDDKLKRIPVVVLTTSRSESDVLKAYGLHANCYVVKPVNFEQFAEVVKSIENFWFEVVTLSMEP